MLKFNIIKTGLNEDEIIYLDIECTKGDTFAFGISSSGDLPTGTSLRLQISPNGDTSDIEVEKAFSVQDNTFNISLTDSELSQLNIGAPYQYRLTFIDISGNIVTTVSGNLIVKWGA